MKIALIAIPALLLFTACSEERHPIALKKATVMGAPTQFNYFDATSASYFRTVYNSAAAADKSAVRNKIIYELLGIVDSDYDKFEQAVRGDVAFKNTMVDIISLSLTGTASLAQKTTANVLSAIDTGFKGANKSVDANAFENNGPTLLINSMRTQRAAVETDIYTNMSKTDAVYPLEAAIRDVEKYYMEGSVTSALVALSASTGDASKTAQKNAADTKGTITLH